jgi:hypothetical protein
MSAYNVLNAAVYSRLSADGALGTLLGGTTNIFYQQAPDHQDYPFVIFDWQAGGDDNITPSRMKNMVMHARGYTTTGAALAGSIDARLDALLHDYTFTVVGWTNFWTAREEDIAIVENPPDGDKVYSAGGFYRVRLGV